MAIVGFGFTKMHAEKRGSVRGKVSINNNIVLLAVEDASIPIAQEKKGVRVRFLFESRYEPAIGIVSFEGEVLLLEDAKVAVAMLEQWQKEKSLPPQLVSVVLNHILDHSNIEALLIARDLNLPPPIQLPRAQLQAIKGEAPKPGAASEQKEQDAKKDAKAKKK